MRRYEGAIEVKAKTPYTFPSAPTGTCFQMKTPDVNVSVNGDIMFPTKYDDESAIDTGATYTFDKDCIVAVFKEV
jgi:hypothetical protein